MTTSAPPASATSAAAAFCSVAATAAAANAVPAVLDTALVPPFPTRKRTADEEQWFLAKETRKAARRRLKETASVVQKLAVEHHAAVKSLDRRHFAADAAHKDANRRLQRAVEAMQPLSEVIFDVEDCVCVCSNAYKIVGEGRGDVK